MKTPLLKFRISRLRQLQIALLAITIGCTGYQAPAQMAAPPAKASATELAPGLISHDTVITLMPPTVFFASRVAPIQMRNTAGVKLPHGVLLAGMVDTAGYSSGIQERYQAYLLVDTPVMLGSKSLPPGAYGCGIVDGQFVVLDLSTKLVLQIAAQKDAAMRRPVPLQATADSATDSFRLYFGRNYISFTAAP